MEDKITQIENQILEIKIKLKHIENDVQKFKSNSISSNNVKRNVEEVSTEEIILKLKEMADYFDKLKESQ